MLLGHTCVCAVEIEPYCRKVLLQRQRDGILPKFPIWDDVRTFDGKPWRGRVDVVCGGFPCQDISVAGSGAGIEGKQSGLWRDMARINLRSGTEIRPRGKFDSFGYSGTWTSPWRFGRNRVRCKMGCVFELEKLEHGTTDRAYSFWLPTPCKSEQKDRSNADILARLDRGGRLARRVCSKFWKNRQPIKVQSNPCFLEWTMDWPIGWTELHVLEMGKFQQWLNSHGKPSAKD